MTEITEVQGRGGALGWIGYDDACGLCTGVARGWRAWLAQLGFELLPIQTDWISERIGRPRRFTEPMLIYATGEMHLGASVLFEIAGRVWWGRPLFWISKVPGVRSWSRMIYRFLARFRYAASAHCQVETPRAVGTRSDVARGALLFLAFLLVGIWTSKVGDWVLMCALAGGLWSALKCFVFWNEGVGSDRSLIWFAWPGTDGCEFFRRATDQVNRPDCHSGLLNLCCGAGLLLWIGLVPMDRTVAAWIGMVGMVFVLHFGLFRIQASLMPAIGIHVSPIMRFPLLAKSLGDLWGNRWNLGFSVPARRYVFRPLVRRRGTAFALMGVFLVSGMLHEIVISIPAGGGYGLPTLYFLIQGLGCLVERKIRSEKFVRTFTFVVAITPVGLLFHPPFIHNVMLPFLEALGIIGKAMA